MKIKFNVKSNTIAAYCIIVFAVCLLLVAVIFKYSVFISYFNKLIGVLSPILWGLAIAYLLNPIMKFVENLLGKFIFKKKKHPKLSRVIGISVSMIILLGMLLAIIGSIVPEIINTIKGIFSNITTYLNNLQDFLNEKISRVVENNPKLEDFLNKEFNNIQDYIISAVNQYQPKLDSLFEKDGPLANLTDSAWTFINGLKNCILGLIVSIYLLYSRDTLIAQSKKIVYALFQERRRNHILSMAKRANSTFSRFISGKAVDSLIVGILCFFGMMLLKMKTYAVIISVIIGVTNMVPFFGPIIGAVPTGLLILLTTPDKTLIFLIFILVLQQFDGNILGPKILGDSLGLSPFWVMFAIFVGGGLFGFAGMIIIVPLFAVVYSIFAELVSEKLRRKRLPIETEYYKFAGAEKTPDDTVKNNSEPAEAKEANKNQTENGEENEQEYSENSGKDTEN